MRAAAAAAKETQYASGADDAAALKKLAKQAGEAAQLLKMLANEKRLLVLCFLAARGEMTVGELVGIVKLSQSALSQHLAEIARRWPGRIPADVADTALSGCRPARAASAGSAKEIYCGELK